MGALVLLALARQQIGGLGAAGRARTLSCGDLELEAAQVLALEKDHQVGGREHEPAAAKVHGVLVPAPAGLRLPPDDDRGVVV